MISVEDFDAEWERCRGWLEPSLEHGGGTHTIEDVHDIILANPLVWFWPGKRAAAVSEVLIFPRLRQLNFWLCGGDMNEIVNDMLPVAEAHGILAGCTRFSTSGRIGWRRVLRSKGYLPALDVCWKDLKKEQAA